ncbi:MAG: hypothetical protein ABIT01_01700 [Thermoanaerobaculia bacterium]
MPILIARPNGVLQQRHDTNGYAAFAAREAHRRAVIFSLASDGLLRAFDAGADDSSDPGTGTELFAYAPRAALASRNSGGALSFDDAYLDAPWAPGGDACPGVASRGASHCQWRTLLAGGFGRAGRSIFVLDVTRPDAAMPRPALPECAPLAGRDLPAGCAGPYPTVLWEFQDESDQDHDGALDLASATSTPSFGRVRLRNARSRSVEEHAVVIFGGGAPDAGAGKRAGGNWLYVVDLESGNTLFKTSFGVARTGPEQTNRRRPFAALASPVTALDLDLDGFTDTLYFGDVNGQLWKLVIPESEPMLAEYDPSASIGRSSNRIRSGKGAWCPYLLVEGGNSGSSGEMPILNPPAVVQAGRTGTGEPIYGVIWTSGAHIGGNARQASSGLLSVFWDVPGPAPVPLAKDLSAQTGANAFSRISSPSAPERGTCRDRGLPRTEGWSLSLNRGERVASDLLVYENYIYVATRLNAPVDEAGGSRLYRLDLETGDSCHGPDCCESAAGAWRSGGGRGRQLPGDLLSTTTPPRIFVTGNGARMLGFVSGTQGAVGARGSGETALSLFTIRLPSALAVRSRQER